MTNEFREALVEVVAEHIWESWRASAIAHDWAKNMSWSDLLSLAAKNPDGAPGITANVARNEARDSIAATRAFLAERGLRGWLVRHPDGEAKSALLCRREEMAWSEWGAGLGLSPTELMRAGWTIEPVALLPLSEGG